ncbi:tetratricopeptide repeat protein [Coleofasciculus sp. FACHB-T130]|uniref:tetratricopeptide repeat protein n=1 Tax=Cyanophyceae TaxID=3028117 RepID=UPI0016875A82|nr:tetratricopeptide repeat protein [Coleofasciculus sp. FACHB-T130]MBD1881361.1 tetratricopeptide repeat protein [Coleofasciculus sp. FACHB-T130]
MTDSITPPGNLILTELAINPPYLAASVLDSKLDDYIAVVNWLMKYKPKPDATNLEKVRGYLEAFHHLCEVENWRRASDILSIRLNTPTKDELHIQLGIWGYHQERIELYKRLLGKLNLRVNARLLGNLGNAFLSFGDYHQAIEYLKQYLTIVRTRGDRSGEAETLGNLGIAYKSIGDYPHAIDYHQQHLAIARETGNLTGEATALNNIAVVHYYLGNFTQANNNYKQVLSKLEEIRDDEIIGKVIGNLGNTLIELKDYLQAEENLQTALKIFKKVVARCDEPITLYNLARLHQRLGDLGLANEYCDRALSIATELNLPLAKECQQLKKKLLSQKV